MHKKNQPLVVDKPISLRNNQLKLKTSENLTIILKEFMEYTLNLFLKNWEDANM